MEEIGYFSLLEATANEVDCIDYKAEVEEHGVEVELKDQQKIKVQSQNNKLKEKCMIRQ